MSKLGKRLTQAAREGRAIARWRRWIAATGQDAGKRRIPMIHLLSAS
jgi:hypothetical protein